MCISMFILSHLLLAFFKRLFICIFNIVCNHIFCCAMILRQKKVWKIEKSLSQHRPKLHLAARIRQSCEEFYYRKNTEKKDKNAIYKRSVFLSFAWCMCEEVFVCLLRCFVFLDGFLSDFFSLFPFVYFGVRFASFSNNIHYRLHYTTHYIHSIIGVQALLTL